MRDSLEKMFFNNVDNTFLWIKLVLRLLESRHVLLTSDILKLARYKPAGLKFLYFNILSAILEEECQFVGNILRLIIVSDRSFSSEEIFILLLIGLEAKSALNFILYA